MEKTITWGHREWKTHGQQLPWLRQSDHIDSGYVIAAPNSSAQLHLVTIDVLLPVHERLLRMAIRRLTWYKNAETKELRPNDCTNYVQYLRYCSIDTWSSHWFIHMDRLTIFLLAATPICDEAFRFSSDVRVLREARGVQRKVEKYEKMKGSVSDGIHWTQCHLWQLG